MVHLWWTASQLRRSCAEVQLPGYAEAALIKAKLDCKQESNAE